MKYRNNFRPSVLKGRVAAFALALSAALLALPGVAGFFDAGRVAAAQEKTRKSPRATRHRELRGAGAAAQRAGRLAGKSPKATSATSATSAGQTSALLACDLTGAGTPIALNTTANGALTLDDCQFANDDSTRLDVYSFDGVAGQQVSISLTSSAFDTYLLLDFDANDNQVIDGADFRLGEDDDGGGGFNSRIPSGSGGATLPLTGRYFIIVTSFFPDEGEPVPTGNYSLTLTGVAGQCPATPITPGGSAVNNSLASPDCRFADDSFFDAYSFSGTAGQQISITLNATLSGGGQPIAYLLDSSRTIIAADIGARIPGTGLVTLPTTGTYFVLAGSTPRDFTADPPIPTPTGSYTLTIANGGQCPTAPITVGQTINNSLTAGECALPDETLADFYTFTGTAGQQVAISLTSSAFDTYLFLNGPAGTVVAEDDDGDPAPSPPDTNSRIPAGSGFFTLPATGTYTILANAFPGGPPTGAYALTLSGPATPASNVQFSAASLSATEGTDHSVLVTVTRAGDTTGEAFVSFATADGTTNERRDYTIALGRLRFAPGDASKSFEVVITDDAYAEGAETFNITLSDPVGATLGAQTTTTVTITSNDGANGPSPVRDASFNAEFFVRQHYADFLGRVPDQDGLNFWVGQTSFCGSPDPLVCRINTSASFFLSIENQETGYLVHRAYRVAFGNLPGKPVPLTFREYIAGSRQIADGVRVGIGNWQQVLEANKVAFFNDFVTTTRFTTAYNGLTNEQYVDALNANASGALDAAERAALINALNGATMTRAEVLRRVAEDADFAGDGRPEKSRAFVLAQYFGYLRRNPDDADFRGIPDPNFDGYNFWLGKLNEFNGNFVQAEMVKAFIESIEYGDRFGQ